MLKFTAVLKAIAYRIRKIRENRELTQEDMGEALDMNGTSYSKIERGDVNITVTRLVQIAEILKVNIIDFFEDKSKANLKETKTDYGYATKQEVSEIAHAVQLLTKEITKLREEIPVKKSNSKPKKKYTKK